MRISTVSSISEISLSEECCFCGVTWHYNNNLRSICPSSSGEVDQGTKGPHWWSRRRPCWHEGTRGHTGGLFDGRGGTRGGEEVLEENEEMTLWFIVIIVKSQVIRSINVPFWRENQWGAHMTSQDNQYFYLCHSSGWREVATSVWVVSDILTATEHTSLVLFFLCHSSSNMPISCLTSFMSHTWIIESWTTNHMTRNWCICPLLLLSLTV